VLIDINAQRSATSGAPMDLLTVTGMQGANALLPIPHVARPHVSPFQGSSYAFIQASESAADKGDVRGVAFPAASLPTTLRSQGGAAGVPPRGTG